MCGLQGSRSNAWSDLSGQDVQYTERVLSSNGWCYTCRLKVLTRGVAGVNTVHQEGWETGDKWPNEELSSAASCRTAQFHRMFPENQTENKSQKVRYGRWWSHRNIPAKCTLLLRPYFTTVCHSSLYSAYAAPSLDKRQEDASGKIKAAAQQQSRTFGSAFVPSNRAISQ